MSHGELTSYAKLEALEAAIFTLPNQYDFKSNTKHYFAHGTYVRELFIPAGVVITGKIHRNSCINIIVSGKIKVITNNGRHDIEGYKVLITGAGVKKAVYTLEDTIFLNVLPWADEPDPEKAEQMLTYDSYKALELNP